MVIVEVWNQQPWVRLGAAVCAALLLALVVRRLGWGVMRRMARGHPIAADVLRRASGPMEWLIPTLMLMLALRLAPEAHSLLALDLLQHLLLVILVITMAWLVIRCIGAFEMAAVLQYPTDRADNLRARRVLTQVRVFSRVANVLIVLLALSAILLSFPEARQIGSSLLASACVTLAWRHCDGNPDTQSSATSGMFRLESLAELARCGARSNEQFHMIPP